jgi:hypothetical protein
MAKGFYGYYPRYWTSPLSQTPLTALPRSLTRCVTSAPFGDDLKTLTRALGQVGLHLFRVLAGDLRSPHDHLTGQ